MGDYSAFAKFYDVLMSDADYPALADCYDGLLGGNKGILLDLACGTGKLSVLMAEKGWDVIGADCCEAMLNYAQPHERVTYICQNMLELDLYGTVDAAICSFDGLNHLADESEVLRALERVSLFMNAGGMLVFDMNTIHKHETILGDNTIVKEAGNVYCVWRNFRQGEGVTDIVLDIFDVGYNRHTVELRERAYSIDTIRGLCGRAGFEVLNCYNFLKSEKAHEKNEKVVFQCKKNQQ
jgi:SAM-dependent methyltransferase